MIANDWKLLENKRYGFRSHCSFGMCELVGKPNYTSHFCWLVASARICCSYKHCLLYEQNEVGPTRCSSFQL